MLDTETGTMGVEDFIFPTITRNDRCDACGAAAATAVLISAEHSMLYFCGHHIRKYRAAFDEKGYSYLLNEDIRRDALFELPTKRG